MQSNKKSKKNLDVVYPLVKHPVVDRLAFILPWGIDSDTDQAELIAPIRRRIQKAIDAGMCERAYPKGSRYRENFRIKLNGGSLALVQIGALQPRRQNGGIRVMLNPAKFVAGDVEQFHSVMRKIVGRDYDALLLRPLINCIDFAVDVEGVCLDHMLVSYTNAQRITMFCKRFDGNGRIEGYNYGSVTSDYMTAVYGKSEERVHAAILELVKNGVDIEGLRSNVVKQLKSVRRAPPVVRVEVRGKKLRGKPLHELYKLPNRFARFRFADLNVSGAKLPELTEVAFQAMCRQNGVKAALAAFKNTEQARAVHAYWRSHQASWWKPSKYWKQACDAVREIGLFPDEAFGKSAE